MDDTIEGMIFKKASNGIKIIQLIGIPDKVLNCALKIKRTKVIAKKETHGKIKEELMYFVNSDLFNLKYSTWIPLMTPKWIKGKSNET